MNKRYQTPSVRIKPLCLDKCFLDSIFSPDTPAPGSDMDIEPLEPGLWG